MEAKNVLVTGAAGGMGRAACELLLGAGCRVWGLDRAEPQEEYAWRFIRADITDAASVEEASRSFHRATIASLKVGTDESMATS
jgi:NAD(P)-dependent dehydrogenase (short-subunit alcohol dehydrogenase family)